MKITHESKQLIFIFVIFFFLAWSLTGLYFVTHLKHVPDGWLEWHERIESGTIGTSNQFRLISFWLAEITSKAFSQPIFSSYLILRFFFTFLTFSTFFLFLLKWFKKKTALLCVILLAAIMPITFLPFLQEADIILYFFFLIGLWLIRENKLLFIASIVFIGTFAKETIVFLIPFYFLVHYKKNKFFSVVSKTIMLIVVWGLSFFITRNAFFEGVNSPLWQLPNNINTTIDTFLFNPLVNPYLYFIPLFGAFWILPFIRNKEKPTFIQRVAPYVIIYMVIHFMAGWPFETRILIPLAFLVIPSGVMALFPQSESAE